MNEKLERDAMSFFAAVGARLEVGEREYGTSQDRPSHELVDEIMQELEDVAGWSILLWSKLRRISDELEDSQG